MQLISGLTSGCAGLPDPYLSIQKCNRSTPRDYSVFQLVSKRVACKVVQPISRRSPRTKIGYFLVPGLCTRYATSASRNHHELSFGNDFLEEPVWLTPIKEAFWALKSLFIFLFEQPSQLKYIEWPSFQNTLKTASLTLLLVALLIVALASVDSSLCYLLALLLRNTI